MYWARTDDNRHVFDHPTGPAVVMEAGGLSPLGTMGQGGNVWERIETETESFLLDGNVNDDVTAERRPLGGSWLSQEEQMSSIFPGIPGIGPPQDEWDQVGFRVASIPEPGSLLLGLLGGLGVLGGRRRSG